MLRKNGYPGRLSLAEHVIHPLPVRVVQGQGLGAGCDLPGGAVRGERVYPVPCPAVLVGAVVIQVAEGGQVGASEPLRPPGGHVIADIRLVGAAAVTRSTRPS